MNLLYIVKEGRKVPRKGHIPKREIMPDPIYNDVVVTKLINGIMLDGKKEYHRTLFTGLLIRLLKRQVKTHWRYSTKQ